MACVPDEHSTNGAAKRLARQGKRIAAKGLVWPAEDSGESSAG
jgi:hypothetical protein